MTDALHLAVLTIEMRDDDGAMGYPLRVANDQSRKWRNDSQAKMLGNRPRHRVVLLEVHQTITPPASNSTSSRFR